MTWSAGVAAFLFTFSASSCLAASPEDTPARDFFEAQAGKIALFPGAKSKSDAMSKLRFVFFPRNGEYELAKRSSTLWFAVNHVVRGDIAEDEEINDPTFLAIQIIGEYDPPYSPSSNVYLYRNKNWIRDDDPKFNGDKEMKRSFASKTITDFFKFQTGSSTLNDFDRTFGKWHAQVGPDDDNSWEFRTDWILTNFSAKGSVIIKNYLIKFTPTTSAASKKWLLFSTNVSNESRVRIRTFAPSFGASTDLFDNDVTIIFK